MNSQIAPDQINAAGHLTIGGVDSLELAKEYAPLVLRRGQFAEFVFKVWQRQLTAVSASKALRLPCRL